MQSPMSSTILCPDTLHQLAFTLYVDLATKGDSLRNYVNQISKEYQIAADHTCMAVEKYLDLKPLIPDGGLYTCINVNRNSAQFVDDVLKNTGVLLVPGWGFGPSMSEAVRISYGPLVHNLNLIEEGLKKVGKYLQ